MKNILILGGCGFLGTNLYKYLSKRDNNVYVYDRASDKMTKAKDDNPSINFIDGNFNNENNWDNILKNIDVVFHLISTTNPSNKDIYLDFSTNVLPTINLLNSIVKYNIRLIFFSSGGTVYGLPQYIPIDEKHPTNPISSYGIQKISIEKIIEYYGRTYEMDYYIFRISNPYGPYQNIHANQGIIPIFINKILAGETIQIWGDGSNVRDYIWIDDLLSACSKIITYSGEYKIFNISSNKGYSINEIIDIIKNITHITPNVQYMPKRVQDVSINILDNELASGELNYIGNTDIYSGIKKMINIFDKQNIIKIKDS